MRLVNSNNRCSGRVEVYHDGEWGTVCDDGWDLNDARVVCRQLDCGSALEAPLSAAFGQGSGSIWLNNVSCAGTEPSITECRHQGFGVHSCGHPEDASVVCDCRFHLIYLAIFWYNTVKLYAKMRDYRGSHLGLF